MQKHYGEELHHLKETLLRMGGLAETMTIRAVQALVERKAEMLPEVKEAEIQRVMEHSSASFNHAVTARRYIDLYEKMLKRPLVVEN